MCSREDGLDTGTLSSLWGVQAETEKREREFTKPLGFVVQFGFCWPTSEPTFSVGKSAIVWTWWEVTSHWSFKSLRPDTKQGHGTHDPSATNQLIFSTLCFISETKWLRIVENLFRWLRSNMQRPVGGHCALHSTCPDSSLFSKLGSPALLQTPWATQ